MGFVFCVLPSSPCLAVVLTKSECIALLISILFQLVMEACYRVTVNCLNTVLGHQFKPFSLYKIFPFPILKQRQLCLLSSSLLAAWGGVLPGDEAGVEVVLQRTLPFSSFLFISTQVRNTVFWACTGLHTDWEGDYCSCSEIPTQKRRQAIAQIFCLCFCELFYDGAAAMI